MNLAASRSARLKNNLVMRLGCVLVAVGFLVSSVVTPRARAVAVVDDVAVGAMSCAAFLESIGLPLSATVTAGVPAAELVSGGITAVAGEYAAATGAAASGEAFLSTVAAGTAISTVGTIVLTAAAVAACAALAYWLYDTYLVDEEPETSIPVYDPSGWYLADGSRINFFDGPVRGTVSVFDYPFFYAGTVYTLSSGVTFRVVDDRFISSTGYTSRSMWDTDLYLLGGTSGVFCYSAGTDKNGFPTATYCGLCVLSKNFDVLFGPQEDKGKLAVTEAGYRNEEFPEIQQSQFMEIIIPSAAPGSSLAELVETVPQQVADGTLSVTYTIETTAPTPPSISDGDIGNVEDVDDLDLPSLGEALTRRFPFSIPWDIARGITLLAAPAKAPYFEVDFYEVIGDRVGGWKGSTKLVLDFSQFESLGRLSRWTSTIGFCLFLASATKRFIWTA